MSIKRKINVAVLFGGKSAEHEVSLRSAKNVVDAMDKDKYNIKLIGIDKNGKWLLNNGSKLLVNPENPVMKKDNKFNDTVAILPQSDGEIVNFSHPDVSEKIDVVFPILHGPMGEDGTVQGLLKLANIPFVGAGVLGSAVGMDKDVMKRLLRDAGIPVSKFMIFTKPQEAEFNISKKELGIPMFIKPANMGSSVGVSKVTNKQEFDDAVKNAFKFDRKILIEEFIEGREVECSVLGNEEPIASIAGEIIAHDDFYSYNAKYIDENGATIQIPADVTDEELKEIQKYAIQTFKALCCEGMGRVDMFLKKDGSVVINEINTIPGFTSISMYPKLWEASGLKYSDLIDKLIQLALERFEKEKLLKSSK